VIKLCLIAALITAVTFMLIGALYLWLGSGVIWGFAGAVYFDWTLNYLKTLPKS